MKGKIGKSAALFAALCLSLCLGGCRGTAREESLPATPSPEGARLPASLTAPALVSEDEVVQGPELAAGEAALLAAQGYRELYTRAMEGREAHLSLPAETLAAIAEALAGSDHAATDTARAIAPCNGEVLTDFHLRVQAGETAEAVLYEVCPDGGFIRHELHGAPDGLWVIHTRLSWSAEGEPVLGYSNRYSVTALRCAEGVFYYEYYMPDNPPGTNHDGHVDTFVEVPLK